LTRTSTLAALVACLAIAQLGLARGQQVSGDKETLVFDAPPAEWKVETHEGMMAPKAAYALKAAEGDSDDAKVTLHYFGGHGGSVEANIDRWRGQFTDASGKPLAPESVKPEKSEVNGLKVTFVEFAGTYQPPSFGGPAQAAKPGWRLVAAIFDTTAGPWFLRLVGPEKTIAKHREAFTKWLKSARWADPNKKASGSEPR
jgi:hypothetical protein